MNKMEFKAINAIAKKMNWMNRPVDETVEDIQRMISNEQSLELSTVGDCDDEEVILLSMLLWNTSRLVRTMFVRDDYSLYDWSCFLEDMHIDAMTAYTLLSTYAQVNDAMAEIYEAEDSFALMTSEYNDADYHDLEIMRDVIWMNHNC